MPKSTWVPHPFSKEWVGNKRACATVSSVAPVSNRCVLDRESLLGPTSTGIPSRAFFLPPTASTTPADVAPPSAPFTGLPRQRRASGRSLGTGDTPLISRYIQPVSTGLPIRAPSASEREPFHPSPPPSNPQSEINSPPADHHIFSR